MHLEALRSTGESLFYEAANVMLTRSNAPLNVAGLGTGHWGRPRCERHGSFARRLAVDFLRSYMAEFHSFITRRKSSAAPVVLVGLVMGA